MITVLRFKNRVFLWCLLLAVVMVQIVFAGAGPRVGTIRVVQVPVPNRAVLDELTQAGYDIGNVREHVATLHATEAELDQLTKDGYDYVDSTPQESTGEISTRGLGDKTDYASLTSQMQAYAAAYPGICRLTSLGQSVEGRQLWAMLITDNPDVEEDEPECKYVANMHGNEWLGLEMCLYFIDFLLTEYGNTTAITELVDHTAIWIVPSMNPDGLEHDSRHNANGYDLNRSFPDFPGELNDNYYSGAPINDQGRQPEVAHIMHWSIANSFVLSANFHTGALLVNYPYDDDGLGSVYSACPDDDLFIDISKRYSMYNLPMWNSPYFPYGISNGADWYTVNGGMQDWNYRYLGDNDVTIELSDSHDPPVSQIPDFWDDNRDSMLAYLQAVHIGVRGLVTDLATGQPLWTQITVQGNDQPVCTDPDVGDYYRMLLPGTYDLTFESSGYATVTVQDVIVTEGAAVRVDVQLTDPDFDDNEQVGLPELDFFLGCWLSDQCGPSQPCRPADLDGDGQVELDDFSLLSKYWLTDVPL